MRNRLCLLPWKCGSRARPHPLRFCLGLYRGLYILNWIYRYYDEEYVDVIAVFSGIIQTILYCDFFYIYVKRGTTKNLRSTFSFKLISAFFQSSWPKPLLFRSKPSDPSSFVSSLSLFLCFSLYFAQCRQWLFAVSADFRWGSSCEKLLNYTQIINWCLLPRVSVHFVID